MNDYLNDILKTIQPIDRAENKLSTESATNKLPRDTDDHALLAAALVVNQSSNKFSRDIKRASTKWKDPFCRHLDKDRNSFEDEDVRKRQFGSFEHDARKPRKLPNSPKSISDFSRTNGNDDKLQSGTVEHDIFGIFASQKTCPIKDYHRRYTTAERRKHRIRLGIDADELRRSHIWTPYTSNEYL